MARQSVLMKAGKIKRTANHIRENMGTEEELRQLGRSFLNRPLNPIICHKDGEVLEAVDGNRRLAGILLEVGPDAEIPICITDEPIDESVKLEIMMESAIHTRGLSDYEEYLGASQWMERNPESTAEELGKRIGRKPAMMTRILSLRRCGPAVRDAAAAELIGISEWYVLSKCSEEEQQALLAGLLEGRIRNRDELARSAKKSRNADLPSVKLTRVNFMLPSAGVQFVVKGDGLSLDDLCDSLGEAVREVKRARDQGQDIKSFQAVMTARAKNGNA